MSTKYPLTLLVMELSEMLKKHGISATLTWVRRDENQAADDLTNEVFEKFSPERRVRLRSRDIHWLVLDKPMEESSILYKEITGMKEAKRSSKKDQKQKASKKGKFFPRWTS